MSAWLRPLLELGPLVAFFGTYQFTDSDLIIATAVFMVAVLLSLAASFLLTKRVPKMLVVTAVVVMVFGGLTIWLNDATFIKMKPTIVYGIFGFVLVAGLIRRQHYLQLLMGEAICMTEVGWRQLTVRWILLFVAMAALNEVIWRTQSEEFWVAAKTFGYLPLVLVFAFSQMPLIKRHWVEQ